MNFYTRIQGVFLSPQQTFKSLAEKPVWKDALIILLIAMILMAYFIAPYSLKDDIEIFEKSIKLKERLGEERFNQELEKLKSPSRSKTFLRSSLLAPITLLIGFLFSCLIILGLGRLTSTEGKYIQVFSVYLHANFIDKILGNALRLFLIVIRKSTLQTTTSLAIFFPRLEVTSPSYLVLSQIDFFQIWLFGVLGLGLAYIFKIDFKKALIISFCFWLLKSILYVAMGYMAAQFVV